MPMLWIIVAIVAVLGYLAYRLLVKPILKIVLLLALALTIWLLLTNYL